MDKKQETLGEILKQSMKEVPKGLSAKPCIKGNAELPPEPQEAPEEVSSEDVRNLRALTNQLGGVLEAYLSRQDSTPGTTNDSALRVVFGVLGLVAAEIYYRRIKTKGGKLKFSAYRRQIDKAIRSSYGLFLRKNRGKQKKQNEDTPT